jgi:hypothetical protein
MATEDDVRAIALSLPGTTEEQWYQTPAYNELRKLITDSWLIKAPPKLRRRFEGQ